MENHNLRAKAVFSSPFLFSATWAELQIEMNEHKAIPWKRLKAQIKQSPPAVQAQPNIPLHPTAKP